MVELGQDPAGEVLALFQVWIAREDEGVDSELLVGRQLGGHLIRIADDRRTAARSRATDARPQALFDEAVSRRRVAQLGLAPDAGGLGGPSFTARRVPIR